MATQTTVCSGLPQKGLAQEFLDRQHEVLLLRRDAAERRAALAWVVGEVSFLPKAFELLARALYITPTASG